MNSSMKFYVYNHHLIIKENQLITRKFICLKDSNWHIFFTDFHKYVMPRKRTIRKVTDDGNNRFDFIVKLLNYVYFYCNISSLDQLTVAHVKLFLNNYGCGTLPNDIGGRTKATVERCIACIMDFLDNLIQDRKGRCSITREELFIKVPIRNKYGRVMEVKMPAFKVVYDAEKRDIFRDIPNSCFEMLFSHISLYHQEILMLVALSSFCGLRPSEACNVRRVDSPLGHGIHFFEIDGEVHKILIDLRKEYCLRSDLIPTGKIKKERLQNVPSMFIEALSVSYNKYMDYIKGIKYETEYGALTVNKQGKAITYDSYYGKFKNIIQKEMIPIYLKDSNPEVVNFGRLLLENNISPHVFRHWYTVQLVLAGFDNPGELMNARGDSSPESALTYIQNKGELDKQYRKVSNEMFNYLLWSSEKKYGDR